MDIYKIQKRNFLFLTIEGALYLMGIAFLNQNTVIPVFIDALTGSKKWVGFVVTIVGASALIPQLIMTPLIKRIRNVPRFVATAMLVFRPMPFIMIPVLFFSHNSYFIVGMLMILFFMIWGGNAVVTVGWMDLFGRTIPMENRGKIHGYQQFFSGMAGLLTGFAIKIILDSDYLQFEYKFALIFGLAGVFMLLSSISMLRVKDFPRKVSREKLDFKKYIYELPKFLKSDRDFRIAIIIHMFSNVGNVSLPYIILFAKNTLLVPDKQVSTMMFIQIMGVMLGGFLWGTLSHKLGNKYVILIVETVMVLVCTMALGTLYIFKTNFIMYFLVFFSGAKSGGWLGYLNYIIDIAQQKNIVDYLLVKSMILFPLSFVNIVVGIIADKWGLTPIFMFSTCAAITAIIVGTKLKSRKEIEAGKETILSRAVTQ